MGIYLNPGKTAYEEVVNSDIFVDKTPMIRYLNSVVKTEQKYVSVSRPRRFGKTVAAKMICAYYDREAKSRQLFEKLKLAEAVPGKAGEQAPGWDVYLNKFDVIRLVMTDFFKKDKAVDTGLEKMQKLVCRDIKKKYPEADYFDLTDLPQTMADVYEATGHQFVIVIDEWDAIFRLFRNDSDGQAKYLDFIRDWLKDKDYIALAYMTGILPIKKYGEHSALNMFTEYSMMAPRQLAQYTGFTEEEVRILCDRYGRDYEKVKDWYDGYEVSDIIPPDPGHEIQKGTGSAPAAARYSLYNPLSVVEAMTTGKIKDYWNKTETYKALKEFIQRDLDGLKDAVVFLMDGGKLRIDTSTCQNDMTTFTGKDDVLSLLAHLGYLGFDDEESEVFIPNREILNEFRTSTKDSEWTPAFRLYDISLELLKATWSRDEKRVAELAEEAHNQAGNKTYSDEAALSYGIQLAYYAAQKYYTKILELDSGKGYADVVYLPAPRYPALPALLIELKYEKHVDSAMTQIRLRNYPDRLEHYKGNMLLVAISYDKDKRSTDPDFKRHSCKIEMA